MEKKRFYNIDFLRFIFCLSIVLFHIPASFYKYSSEIKDFTMHFRLGNLCVDFFFIVAGLFWCLNADKCKNMLDFIVKKVIRMWPVMCFGIVLCGILAFFNLIKFDIYANIETLCFLNGLKLNFDGLHSGRGNLYATWFISALFWILILFQYLYQTYPKKNINLIMAVLILVLLPFEVRSHGGGISTLINKNIFPVISFPVIRGLYSCAIGYFIAELYKNFNPIIENIKLNTKWNLILSTINCSALGILTYNLFIEQTLNKHVAFLIICFVAILILFLFNKDSVSQFFNKKFLGSLGLFSFSIFVMHTIPIDIFRKHLFIKKYAVFINEHPVELMAIYIISILALGIATYMFVEKPATNKLLTQYKNLKEKTEIFN